MPIEKLLVEFEGQAMLVAADIVGGRYDCFKAESRQLEFLRRAIESACACERQRAAALSPSFG